MVTVCQRVDSICGVMVLLADREQLDQCFRMVRVQLVGFEFDPMTGLGVFEHQLVHEEPTVRLDRKVFTIDLCERLQSFVRDLKAWADHAEEIDLGWRHAHEHQRHDIVARSDRLPTRCQADADTDGLTPLTTQRPAGCRTASGSDRTSRHRTLGLEWRDVHDRVIARGDTDLFENGLFGHGAHLSLGGRGQSRGATRPGATTTTEFGRRVRRTAAPALSRR